MMFARLKALRDKLASVPSVLCDAETRAEIVKAIDELDDAMVMDVRAREMNALGSWTGMTMTEAAERFAHSSGMAMGELVS